MMRVMTPKDTTPTPRRVANEEVPPDQRMTAPQVAVHLGIRLNSWWSYTSRGQAPAARRDWSGTAYWSRPEIEAWQSSRQGRWGAHRAAKAAAAAAKKAPAKRGRPAAKKATTPKKK